MSTKSSKELIIILTLTIVVGVAGFFFAKRIDETIANVTEIRHHVDELMRFATNQEERIKEIQTVDEYAEVLESNLPHSENLVDILEQLETMAYITENSLSISLEEGSISGGKLDFTNKQEKNDFLNSLTVKEYTIPQPQTDSSSEPVNYALQLTQPQEQKESDFKINYVEINLILNGSYDSYRKFVSLLDSSKYLFNIKEMRINKSTDGNIEGTLIVRAFIFES